MRHDQPGVHARPRAHAERALREAAPGHGRGEHRHAVALQPGQRLVRDRRAHARGRPVRAAWWRAVAVVQRDDTSPHLFTEFPEGAPGGIPNDHLHPAVEVEAAEGAAELVAQLPGGRLALDDAPFPLWHALGDRELIDANIALGSGEADQDARRARVHTPGAGHQRAGRCAAPGSSPSPARSRPTSRVRSCARSRSWARRRTPSTRCSRSCRPRSRPDPSASPVIRCSRCPTRPRELEAGDVLWIDTGINLQRVRIRFRRHVDRRRRARRPRAAASSTSGATIVDRVLEVTKPGATGADLVRAAGRARRPEALAPVLLPGPRHRHRHRGDAAHRHRSRRRVRRVDRARSRAWCSCSNRSIWDDGHAGHRSEEIIAITDDGYQWLSSRAELDGVGA